jgi:hypothetical protein
VLLNVNLLSPPLDMFADGGLTSSVYNMFFISCIYMDRVHINQALSVVATEAMDIPFYTFLEDIIVPGGVPSFTAEDQGDGRVEELQGFSPLISAFCVVFLGELLHLPWAPAFVA